MILIDVYLLYRSLESPTKLNVYWKISRCLHILYFCATEKLHTHGTLKNYRINFSKTGINSGEFFIMHNSDIILQ